MVLKKNRGRKKARIKKKISPSAKKNVKYTKSLQNRNKKRNARNKPNIIIPLILNPIQNLINAITRFISSISKFISSILKFINSITKFILKIFQDLLKAPFLFINIVYLNLI